MKKIIIILILCFSFNVFYAQNAKKAELYIKEGINLYDQGKYSDALKKYDRALRADKDNLIAMSEKAMTLMVLKKYSQAISLCKKIIGLYPESNNLAHVYMIYGTTLDYVDKPEKAIEIYNEGIKRFPQVSKLHFNKAVTLLKTEKAEEALEALHVAAVTDPFHAGTHNLIGFVENYNKNKTPHLFARSMFLILEREGERAEQNLDYLNDILYGNIEKGGRKSMKINIDLNDLDVDTSGAEVKPNDFSSVNMILAFSGAISLSKKTKKLKLNEAQKFKMTFESVVNICEENLDSNYGFYWDYYVPYFIAVKDNDYLDEFVHVAYTASNDRKVKKWLKNNDPKVREFLMWTKQYWINFKYKETVIE